MEKLITRLAGRVSFHGLDVIVRFDPESLTTELKHLSYGATTEQPTHLLNFIYHSSMHRRLCRQFFLDYFASVFQNL